MRGPNEDQADDRLQNEHHDHERGCVIPRDELYAPVRRAAAALPLLDRLSISATKLLGAFLSAKRAVGTFIQFGKIALRIICKITDLSAHRIPP